MKKVYMKPQIMFDCFELSQDIAAGCEEIANHARSACPLVDEESGMTLFEDSAVCQTTSPGYLDKHCYHVPTEAYNVFSS